MRGHVVLVVRLAARDLRQRAAEATLLLVALVVATTTLTLGLVLHGELDAPYARTRAATHGPDVVAAVFPEPFHTAAASQLSGLAALEHAHGVTGHSGPFPVTWSLLHRGDVTAGAEVEGRDQPAAAVDQPAVTSGTWVRRGGAVLERTFATALDARVGDQVSIGGRVFRVVGIAVTTAFTPYPRICTGGCIRYDHGLRETKPGLVWLTRADTRATATKTEPLAYVTNLRLSDPSAAPSFAAARNDVSSPTAPMLRSWQDISYYAAKLERNEQQILMIGSWLLALIGVATVTVLVGARVADQTKRAGLLKAVGGAPGLIAAVLVAEYLAVAMGAVFLGLLAGRLVAPSLAPSGVSLLGHPGPPSLQPLDVGLVAAVAFGITVLATFLPALRAARTSTVRALGGGTRSSRRHPRVVSVSRHLPVPLLVGMRIAAHRPRRALLGVLTVAVAVVGVVAVMYAQATLNSDQPGASTGLPDPNTQRLGQVMLALTILLTIMTMVNLIFVASTTAIDASTSLAVTRALGATPAQAAGGLAAAQIIPALLGVALGWPAGAGLFAALDSGRDSVMPPLWWLIAMIPATALLTAALTALPARLSARRPIAATLSAGSP